MHVHCLLVDEPCLLSVVLCVAAAEQMSEAVIGYTLRANGVLLQSLFARPYFKVSLLNDPVSLLPPFPWRLHPLPTKRCTVHASRLC